jgi:hypothetical protein
LIDRSGGRFPGFLHRFRGTFGSEPCLLGDNKKGACGLNLGKTSLPMLQPWGHHASSIYHRYRNLYFDILNTSYVLRVYYVESPPT